MAISPYMYFIYPFWKSWQMEFNVLASTSQRQQRINSPVSDGFGRITLPNSPGLLYKNRSAWAATCFSKPVFLIEWKRGHYTISKRGRDLLSQNPAHIDLHTLSQYPEFSAFHQPKARSKPVMVKMELLNESPH